MGIGENAIANADTLLNEQYEEPLSLPEYIDTVAENPQYASHASKYLLEAIEHYGTRAVIEEGEEKERYRFFDDPENAGEHAILGNTDVLNDFVDDLRSIAAERGKDEKILWLQGPTATGKSELKRCLTNGLREYSKTDDGRRYTVEWNIEGTDDDRRGLGYNDQGPDTDEDENWYESPVQTHPLSVLPDEVRSTVLDEINASADDAIDIVVDTDMDPFSREAYNHLEDVYRQQGTDDLFSDVTNPQHLRVMNYTMDVGKGIGVLHSEDDGQPKERLVGSWMRGMLQELDSRGRKNPQAFSYDGVLGQGNGGITVVEDAAQHIDLLQKLLNVPDEGVVKLDKGIRMDIDTQMIIISNPDLEQQLDQYAQEGEADPLKSLKRRLDKREFNYLTEASSEAELLHRELTNETARWEMDDYEQVAERMAEPLYLTVRDSDGVETDVEIAPHTVEAAALYSVVTRLDDANLPEGYNVIDKALLYDRGYLMDESNRLEKDDLDFIERGTDGESGLPVTYTRDVLAELLQDNDRMDRHHPELPVEDVIMPGDVLQSMVAHLDDTPVVAADEQQKYEGKVVPVEDAVFSKQEEDVLDAIMRDVQVDEDVIEEYIEHVDAWLEDEQIENSRGEREEPDPLKMKVFEIEHLGQFDDDDYESGHEPVDDVEEFRREKIQKKMGTHAWHNRGTDFTAGSIDVKEIPVLHPLLETNSWDDVKREYEDFDPRQWSDPKINTETATVKEQAIENMHDMFGYSNASAELTSRKVMEEVEDRWD